MINIHEHAEKLFDEKLECSDCFFPVEEINEGESKRLKFVKDIETGEIICFPCFQKKVDNQNRKLKI